MRARIMYILILLSVMLMVHGCGKDLEINETIQSVESEKAGETLEEDISRAGENALGDESKQGQTDTAGSNADQNGNDDVQRADSGKANAGAGNQTKQTESQNADTQNANNGKANAEADNQTKQTESQSIDTQNANNGKSSAEADNQTKQAEAQNADTQNVDMQNADTGNTDRNTESQTVQPEAPESSQPASEAVPAEESTAVVVEMRRAEPEGEPVAYNPQRVVALAEAKCKANGMTETVDNLNSLLAEGKITQEQYNDYYPNDGMGYLSVFVETDLRQASKMGGELLGSEEGIASYLADTMISEGVSYFYIDCAGTYDYYGKELYEFRCYR